MDDNGVRGAAGVDRRDGLLSSYAHAGGIAWSAGLGRSADSAVGGWHDRCRLHHAACRLAIWGRGGVLPWALLVVGSVASLAANVAVAESTVAGRVIAAWPSFALIGAYELLMRHVRGGAASSNRLQKQSSEPLPAARGDAKRLGRDLQREAWEWAQANREADGSLPSGREIA